MRHFYPVWNPNFLSHLDSLKFRFQREISVRNQNIFVLISYTVRNPNCLETGRKWTVWNQNIFVWISDIQCIWYWYWYLILIFLFATKESCLYKVAVHIPITDYPTFWGFWIYLGCKKYFSTKVRNEKIIWKPKKFVQNQEVCNRPLCV